MSFPSSSFSAGILPNFLASSKAFFYLYSSRDTNVLLDDAIQTNKINYLNFYQKIILFFNIKNSLNINNNYYF